MVSREFGSSCLSCGAGGVIVLCSLARKFTKNVIPRSTNA